MTNVYSNTTQIEELINIKKLKYDNEKYPHLSSLVKVLLDINKISHTLDVLKDKDSTTINLNIMPGLKNISRICMNDIWTSYIYILKKQSLQKDKINFGNISVLKNLSSFPYTINKCVYVGEEGVSVIINTHYYEHTKIPTMKIKNKFSNLKGQHKIVDLKV